MAIRESESQHYTAFEAQSTSSPAAPSLSIIIPTRNESGNIEPLLQRIQRALKDKPFSVIFVDDSTDNTEQVITEKSKQFSFETTVIARPPERRNGLGKAVVEGIQAAKSEWIVVMDGDLQHPPEVINELMDRAQSTGADLVVASRLSEGGSTAGLSLGRNIISRTLAWAMRLCFPKNLRHVSDPLTGFFLLRRSHVTPENLRPEGFKILLEIMIRNPQLQVAEVPFEFGKRHSGTSKASSQEMLRLMRQTIKLRMPTLLPIIRFLTVGISGIAINSALLVAFTELLGVHYLLSAVFATQGSTLWNFAGIEWWVFRGRSQSSLTFWQRMAGFLAMNNAMLLLRGPMLALLVSQLGINYLAANVISLGAMTLIRFAVSDSLLWGMGSARKTYSYNIHDIIRIRSEQRLPELGYFRTNEALDNLDFEIAIVGNPQKYRTAESIVYDEVLGRFGFSIVINRHETPIKVYASTMIGLSPHVLYTNVIEPLLRWTFVRKGYALMHGACIAVGDEALFITAQTDTGKTTTILKTIREQTARWQFLSDDMTIITKEGRAMSFPKPLTISQHTLQAVQCEVLSFREQMFLKVQSRLHSRQGRIFALMISKFNLPAATINAVVQAIVPPPKYMVDRLIPGTKIIRNAQLTSIAVIERGPEFERGLGEQEKLRILVANAEDAYGFPPYPVLAHVMSSWQGVDLHGAEGEIVASAIKMLPAIHMRRAHYDWYQRLHNLVGERQQAEETPIPVRGLESVPILLAADGARATNR